MILEEFGIELAPVSPFLTYDEAKMYCFTLTHANKIGWRMPVFEEYSTIPHICLGWYDGAALDSEKYNNTEMPVTPVRDLR